MITDVGKTTPSVFMGDGSICTFINETITNASWDFKDTNNKSRYKTVIQSSALANKNRALHFYKSYPGAGFKSLKIPVVYIPKGTKPSETGAATQFLYECIAPQISVNKEQVFQLFFWTNVSSMDGMTKDANGEIEYDQKNVVKFSTDSLGDLTSDSVTKLLCTANINFELLSTASSSRMLVPVIRKITVLDSINDGSCITDFAGGGGNGLKIHNHADNKNGGFAFGVYAPSSIMRVLSWE